VYSFARDGDAVIVGLGSNFLLRGLSHVLRVLTVAPSAVRIERVMQVGTSGGPSGLDDLGPLDQDKATDVVRRADRERGGYIRYMHNADWLDVHAYDLVLNTGNLAVERAIGEITYTLERAEIAPTATSLRAIEDLTLASRVEAVLVSHAGIWIHGLKATAEQGVVTIAGEVITDEDREYAEEAARGIPNVRAVQNELRIQPPPLTGM
jgi:cytidylate kinase